MPKALYRNQFLQSIKVMSLLMETIKRTFTSDDGTYGEAISTLTKKGDQTQIVTRIAIISPDGKKMMKTITSTAEFSSAQFSLSGFQDDNQAELEDDSNVRSEEENVNEFFRMTNEFRQQNGKPPLEFSKELSDIAREHNDAMIAGTRPFGHEGFQDRIKLIQGAKNTAENCSLSIGNKDYLNTLFTNLVNSPMHKANMLGDFHRVGIVIGRSQDHKWYATQLFSDN